MADNPLGKAQRKNRLVAVVTPPPLKIGPPGSLEMEIPRKPPYHHFLGAMMLVFRVLYTTIKTTTGVRY